jgi:hypothetical protein
MEKTKKEDAVKKLQAELKEERKVEITRFGFRAHGWWAPCSPLAFWIDVEKLPQSERKQPSNGRSSRK